MNLSNSRKWVGKFVFSKLGSNFKFRLQVFQNPNLLSSYGRRALQPADDVVCVESAKQILQKTKEQLFKLSAFWFQVQRRCIEIKNKIKQLLLTWSNQMEYVTWQTGLGPGWSGMKSWTSIISLKNVFAFGVLKFHLQIELNWACRVKFALIPQFSR